MQKNTGSHKIHIFLSEIKMDFMDMSEITTGLYN